MKEDVSSDIDRSNKSESEENEDKKNKDAQPQEQKKQRAPVFDRGALFFFERRGAGGFTLRR